MRQIARGSLWVFLAIICVNAQGGLQVDKASIGGTVTNGGTGKPEAGVWVIAETKLGVPYRKIVVTDDQGRFLAPDLPAASYDVWVRGYGLKDSAKTKAERGAEVKLQVSTGPTLVTIPNVVGQPRATAEALLNGTLGLGVQVNLVNAGAPKKGIVIAQSPQPGAQVPKGSATQIFVGS